MPIYEYDCPVCGRFETIQRFSDSTLTECPTCAEQGKKSHVEKAVSVSAFHLKGGGWYKTDYAKSGSSASTGPASGPANKEGNDSGSGDSGSSGSGSATTSTAAVSESKPATEKSESKESKSSTT